MVSYVPVEGICRFVSSTDPVRAQTHFNALVDEQRKSEPRLRVVRTPERGDS